MSTTKAFHRLLIVIVVLSLTLVFAGCSKKHKSSRGAASTGGGTGSGTGTGTGTGSGTGPNGTGDPGGAKSLDLTWAVQETASQADLEYMADKIKFYNEGLWEGTEGQAYLKDQTLVNGSSDGNVIVRVIKGPISNPPAACKTSGGGFQITLCSGQLPRQGFLHELGHGWVGPFYSEEYNCLNASEGVCVMAMMVGLSGEGYSKWCDPTTCVESQQCWNLMQSTHGWAHPGPGGAAPACNVTIQ